MTEAAAGAPAPAAPTSTTAGTGAVASDLRRLTVVSGPRRHDVVVDAELLLADVLALIFPGAQGRVALSMAGEVLPLDKTVDEAALANGSMFMATAGEAESLTGPRVTSVSASTAMSAGGRRRTGPLGLDGGVGTGRRGRGGATAKVLRGPAAGVAAGGVPSAPGSGSSRGAMVSLRPASLHPASQPGRPGPVRSPTSAPVVRPGVLAAGVMSMVLAALSVLAFNRAPGNGPGAVLIAGVLLFLCATAVAQIPGADPAARLAAPALGAAGGAVATGFVDGGAQVQMIGACSGAALVALVSRSDRGPDRLVPRVWLAFSCVLGLLALVTLVTGTPLSGVAIAALALCLLLARVLPNLVFDVDDDVLLDIPRLSATSWSPREARRTRRRGWRIDDEAVERLVIEATVEQLAALVGLTVTVLASCVILMLDQGQNPSWPVRLLLVAAATALSLTARAYRRRVDRVLLRVAAATALLALALPWLGGLREGAALATAVVVLVVGVLVAAFSAAVGNGYTSLWAARLADLAESVSLLSALPLAVWGVGLFSWFWALTSG